MIFFNSCETVEDVKKLYKELAKQHHPDLGGNTETMQRLNTEYAVAIAKILKGEKLSQEQIDEAIHLSEYHRAAIEKLMGLEGLVIEVVGTWLWVSGNTYPVKAQIKEAGFYWASEKKKWYWRPEEYKQLNYGKTLSMEQIRAKYGSQTVTHSRKNLN